MTETVKKCEILAPAGSAEQLVAAVNNGCDSVYLGLESFNARMKAPNFTRDNISEWVDYCHLFGVKVYITLNTSLKNDEFAAAAEMLKVIYRSGADGVIVTDLALMRIASQLPKPFEVVASTQLNVYNRSGAEFVREYGATSVVCARESNLSDIEEIAATGIKTECFIHGATCVCQSGQCLFSAMVGGNSGNRGLCAQPCRKLYRTGDSDEWRYLLSARDLCGLNIAEKLRNAGVSTYKIEGRNRRAEYAGITSRVYRKLFDNRFRYEREDERALAEIYNRDMAVLDYLSGGNANIISDRCQNHCGVAVGEVSNGKIKTSEYLTKGDGFKIFDNGREVCGAVALKSGTGMIDADFGQSLKNGMEVRRTTSVELCDNVLTARRKLPVKLRFHAKADSRAVITAECNGAEVQLESEFIVQEALQTPTSSEEITSQLQKTGNSYYTITDIIVETDNIFIAKSQINGLRREILDKLTAKLIERYNDALGRDLLSIDAECTLPAVKKAPVVPKLAVICYAKSDLADCREADILIYKPSVLDRTAFETADNYGAYVDLPSNTSVWIYDILKDLHSRIVCHNIGQVQWARELQLDYIAGSGLNIYNDYIAEVFCDAKAFVYSLELTLSEISRFANRSGLIFADGKITLMKFVHCPFKVATNCKCDNCRADSALAYRDEQGNEFQIMRRKELRCTFELINGKKLSAAARLKRPDGYLVDYDKAVLRHYKALNNGIDDGYKELRPYTKGRLFDKVN